VNTSPRVLGNRYEVGDLLGRGGMAEVHLGRDTRLGRTVAIKLLRTDLARDATFQARFRREAQSAASLNHPAIVSVYDTGEEVVTESGGGVVPLPYIVMEYIEGRTLRDMLRGGQPLEVGLAMEITAGVLAALEYSHKAGIVHRDIKPANVMLTPRGDVKVMDFGIARALADSSATMTQTQAVIGTAQYLSPEQARGETVDARSDLYSAGCLLYELLTARPPFVADSPVAVAYQHVRELPQPPSVHNPAIPENVDRIVLHSLEKDRESRYQSAALFRADLDSARAGRPVQAYAGAGSAAAAAAAAATEFMPQAGTRAMTSVGSAQPGGGLLPGAPGALQPGLPVNDPDGQWDDDERSGGGRRAGYALLFVAVLLVFGLIAFFVAKSIGNDTPDVVQASVPDLRNVPSADAVKQIEDLGLVAVTETAPSDNVEKDLVIKTTPAAGAKVDKGGTVTLTVSAGPDVVPVPDVAGFTQWCDERRDRPEEVVATLQDLITRFEASAQRHGAQKIKTVGDAFMAVAGLNDTDANPALTLLRCGMDLIADAAAHSAKWPVRVGIHVGPVVTGVLGQTQFSFDVWGHTVNAAARMESNGRAGVVTLSDEAWADVSSTVAGSPREALVKGVGAVTVWDVLGVQ